VLPTGLTIRDYDYEVSLDGGASQYASGRTGRNLRPVLVSQCPQDRTCSMRIRAVLDTGLSKWSVWKAAPQIGAPALVAVLISPDRKASVWVTPPKLSAGLTIRDYDYEVSLDGGTSQYASGRLGTTKTPAFATDCPQDQTCSFRVRAVLDAGLSFWSASKQG
jgi:hypothetical protein